MERSAKDLESGAVGIHDVPMEVRRAERELRRSRWVQSLRVLGIAVMALGAAGVLSFDLARVLLIGGVGGALAAAVHPVGRRARQARLVLARWDRVRAELAVASGDGDRLRVAAEELEAREELDAFLKGSE